MVNLQQVFHDRSMSKRNSTDLELVEVIERLLGDSR